MARIKVRFNLGRGTNYMKWKVTYPDGNIEYYNPTEVQLVMKAVIKLYVHGCCVKILKSLLKTLTNQTYKVDVFATTHVFNPTGCWMMVL